MLDYMPSSYHVAAIRYAATAQSAAVAAQRHVMPLMLLMLRFTLTASICC